MMSKDKLVLDSFALLAYFQDERGANEVTRLIKKAQAKACDLKLSAINWGEIYYHIVRSKGKDAAQQYLLLIEQLPIEIIDPDRDLIKRAAILKSQYVLSYADCFAAALAQREDCPVLTGDREFQQLASLIKVHFLPSR